MALNDPLDMLVNIKHLDSAQTAVDNYKKEIYSAFTTNIITPLCRKIEEELRHVSDMLGGPDKVELLLNSEAQVAEVLRRLSSTEVFHLSCHGEEKGMKLAGLLPQFFKHSIEPGMWLCKHHF